MNHKFLKPRQALNKAFLKVKPVRTQIEVFKDNLVQLLDQINESEREEHLKNLVSDFLKRTFYEPDYFINTKKENDLVIHIGKDGKSPVGVILETKRPSNKAEMLSLSPEAKSIKSLNVKSFQELVLYFLRERITQNNLEIKHLVVTNIYEWFVFDASVFEKAFAQNKNLVKDFKAFESGSLSGTTTDFFYKEIAAREIDKLEGELAFTYFDLRTYDKPLRNADKKDDVKLIALFKLLSPEHMLKLPFTNDSNSLDKRFYSELLHIIGLSETKEGGKKLIGRNKSGERHAGSILENAIVELDSLDKISRLERPSQYGNTIDERLFNVALELSITWVNRILFLKLLEAQLITYHKGDKSYSFLNLDKIKNYDDLNSLFFKVLARKYEDRSEEIIKVFGNVPYLNSSLFEPTDMEHDTLFISNLRDEKTVPIISSTVLKNEQGKKRTGNLSTLEYLFEFLNAYDFSSEGSEDIQEDNKTLINASVLGLIFEKINGYKDGSFFTPGFITMYMCRETIRRAVVQKFKEAGFKLSESSELSQSLDEIYDQIEDRKQANEIVNSIKICDPAVGSGHFLVSALNEMIAVKNDLKILQDRDGKRLKEYQVEVVNDELIVTDEEGELFEYNPSNKESQRIQETLFHEKQTIIENCLFGVDINPNSVKICRLRLWIELLKNAYYKQDLSGFENLTGLRALETLPNIDINIKCGNSLVSRFAIDADLSEALKKSKFSIDSYRMAVTTYRNAQNKQEKREMERLIAEIKSDFRSEIANNDPKIKRKAKLGGELYNLTMQTGLFEVSAKEKKDRKKKVEKIEAELEKLSTEIEEIKNNKIYENAFEWRFEFPEVLNESGDFVGFDVVIGNPPYIRQEELKEFKALFKSVFSTYSGTADIYVFFIERGFSILKENGFINYIMPNKFMQAGYGKAARNFLLQNDLVEILDFGDLQVFEEATTYPCILTAKKSASASSFTSVPISTLDFPDGFASYVVTKKGEINQETLSDETWVISNAEDQNLLVKIKKVSKPLYEFLNGEANYGIKTGLSEAFFIDEVKKQYIFELDPRSIDLIKPLLRGRDVKPWYSRSDNSYLIGTFPSLKIDIEEFQGIKKHLEGFGIERLEQSGLKGSRKKTSGKWFETQDSIAYWKEFEKPKIMYQVFQVKPCFIYDEENLYCNNSMWILPTNDKVLLGILNSRIGWWLISKYCTAIQNGYQLIWKYFSQIPIATGNESIREQITELVNTILSNKKEAPSLNTTYLESQIDQLVYELYGLTEEEIRIVEGGDG
ncbi:class I SAM-dependent DNA methyltransferase [Belliella pelovolcani]|nr:Eco57I restriction-modification methylase domain-containing protein [Belliella pelovolcani]